MRFTIYFRISRFIFFLFDFQIFRGRIENKIIKLCHDLIKTSHQGRSGKSSSCMVSAFVGAVGRSEEYWNNDQ